MVKRFILVVFLWSVAAGPPLAAGQDDPDAARQAAEQRAREAELARQQYLAELADRQMREKSIKDMQDFQRDVRDEIRFAVDNAARRNEMERRRWTARIRGAFEEFGNARDDFREALGFGSPIKNPAKAMGKSTEVFLDYMKVINKRRPRLDSSEFKGMKEGAIGQEALTTAERLVPRLEEVLRNDNESSVDVTFFQSLPAIEKELLRLRWMTRQLR